MDTEYERPEIDHRLYPDTPKDQKVQEVRVHRGRKRRRRRRKSPEIPKSEVITTTRYNLSSLNYGSVRVLYQKRLDEKLDQERFNDNEQHYKHIKDCIHAAAKEAMGLYEPEKRKKPYWWYQEIESQIEVKRKAYSKFLNSQTNQDKTHYKNAQAKVQKMICQRKNDA